MRLMTRTSHAGPVYMPTALLHPSYPNLDVAHQNLFFGPLARGQTGRIGTSTLTFLSTVFGQERLHPRQRRTLRSSPRKRS